MIYWFFIQNPIVYPSVIKQLYLLKKIVTDNNLKMRSSIAVADLAYART